MRDFISARTRAIPPSGIRRFFDIVQEMDDVISLGVGEPDYSTPWVACEAGIASVEQSQTSYTSNRGLPALRTEVSRYLGKRFGIQYHPEDEMLITTGASEALDIAIRAVTDPGDEILIADPCYVSYSPGVMLSDGVPVQVPCRMEDEFRLTPDALMEKITPKSKAVICNFPNNPTGGVMSREDYRGIAEVICDHDLLLISDEIYTEMTYDGEMTSAVQAEGLQERTILINGFSKAYAMTGWRVAYLCAPKELCDAALKIHQYVMLSAPTMSQYAAVGALKNADLDREEMVTEYQMRRNLFVRGLNRIGLTCHLPRGAFYAFPSVKEFGLSDVEFAERLLMEEHVAVVPGSVFGPSGAGHLRCSYAISREGLREALRRIEKFTTSL